MSIKPYAFRRCDNSKIVWVDWPTMMNQDAAGYITLADGSEARRCVHLERHPRHRAGSTPRAVPPPAISDSLGFPEQCLADRQAQLDKSGCLGIEFKRDPQVPEFYQVHASSRKAMDKYTRMRNLVNRTGSLGGGVMLTQQELDRAAELACRSGQEAWERR